MKRAVQTDLFGGKKELYYCIHCPWHGYDVVKDGKFEVCPECNWVCYSDSEVESRFLGSNVYPKLAEKWARVHHIPPAHERVGLVDARFSQ